jgi:hypothetical protein
MDGLLAIGGCDKNMPGAMIAIARLDVPAVFVYGGTIEPGHYDGQDLTIVSVFEAVGEYAAGRIPLETFQAIERHACPGNGSCGGMFTANTMSSAIEALGLSLPVLEHGVGRRRRQAGLDRGERRGPAAARRRRRPSARPHDARGVRERDHGRHGDRRQHERGPPPAGDREGGRGDRSIWTTSRRSGGACRTCATSSPRGATSPPTCIVPAASPRS